MNASERPQQDIRPGSSGNSTLLTASEEGDPVLQALGEAREHYLQACETWEQQQSELQQAREAERRASDELNQARSQLSLLRQRAERQRERADRLAASLKSIHRALFDGNVYSLILKACLQLTGATRGLYVTTWGQGQLRARAAVDMDGYPRAPLSPFLRALCYKVMEDEKSLVANHPEDFQQLPEKPGSDEAFRNCLVSPAVLLREFNGVVILADKAGGAFDQEDIDAVLAIGDQAAVAVENQRLHRDLVGAYFAIVGVLSDAVEAKDPYTYGHCEMVSRYSRRVAERLGLSPVERSIACYGGLLHDVGKIGVSDGILNKPGKLIPEEWELMCSHVRIGRDLLAHVPALQQVSEVVMHHHERYDGRGYPQGLKGEEIPLAARIVCVVDAYCAMIAKRSYKDSYSDTQARAELLRCKGAQFDPAVVDAFLAVLDEPPEDEGPDGCELLPGLGHPSDFHHALK